MAALHLKGEWASLGSVIITMMFVVGCVIATRLINTMGRRKMVIQSFCGWFGIAWFRYVFR
jgi:putative MFS transporter